MSIEVDLAKPGDTSAPALCLLVHVGDGLAWAAQPAPQKTIRRHIPAALAGCAGFGEGGFSAAAGADDDDAPVFGIHLRRVPHSLGCDTELIQLWIEATGT